MSLTLAPTRSRNMVVVTAQCATDNGTNLPPQLDVGGVFVILLLMAVLDQGTDRMDTG